MQDPHMTDVCCIGQGWQVKVAVGYNEAYAGDSQIGEDITLPLAVVIHLGRKKVFVCLTLPGYNT